MNLPAELVSLLQDEAYTVLCQESVLEALAKLNREKEEILSTRPPFGMLATSQTRQIFRTSMRAALDNEVGLRNRLDQLGQIELWLKVEIDRALTAYLPTVSSDFRTCYEAANVVTKWENAVSALDESSLALARDARGVAAALNPMPVPNLPPPTPAAIEQARQRALGNLRVTITAIQAGIAEVMSVRGEFAQLCDTQADALQLPPPPEFRTLAWVDKLATLPAPQTTAEAVRCEAEARAYCGEGIKNLLRQSAEVREACMDAAKAILAQHWRQFRAHAQAHYVKERDLDEVIAELTQHRAASDIHRRQASFEAANVASMR